MPTCSSIAPPNRPAPIMDITLLAPAAPTSDQPAPTKGGMPPTVQRLKSICLLYTSEHLEGGMMFQFQVLPADETTT